MPIREWTFLDLFTPGSLVSLMFIASRSPGGKESKKGEREDPRDVDAAENLASEVCSFLEN